MRKTLSFILACTMLLSLMTACGGTTPPAPSVSPSSGAPAAPADGGAPVEISFWVSLSGAMGEAIDKLVSDYNASQTKVHVTAEFQGNYYDMAAKLQTAVTSGESPNIAQLEMGRTKMFADYGILYDMTDAAKTAGIDTSGFYPGLMTSCDYGQGLYALPFNRSTPMMYYNADMFKEVGLDPDAPPKNWTELREYAKKLSKKDSRWGFEVPIDAWFYEAFIMQSGSRILNEDETDIAFENKAGTDPLHLWEDMIAEGSMKAPPGKEYNSYEAARNDLAAGVTGMIITSSGDLRTLTTSCDFDLRTCFLPANTQFGVPTGGANVVVLNGHDEEISATMDFLKFMTDAESAAIWSAATGYVPSTPAASETETYKAFLKEFPIGSTAQKQLLECTSIPRPISENYPEIHAEIMMTEIQRCIEDPAYTPEMAVKAIGEQARALLKK